MGGSSGKSNSSSQNQSTFNQSIPQFQQNALTQMYQAAKSLFDSTSAKTNSQVPGASSIVSGAANSALPALQSSMQGGAYKDLGTGDALMQSLAQSLNSPTNTQKIYGDMMGGNGNNYADAMKASYTADANNATNNMLRNLDARAAGAGMSGSSQHGIAEGLGLQGINNNLQKNLAQTGYDTFNQDLQNKLNIAGQADSNTLSRQQMLQQMLGSQQDTVNNAMNTSASQVQNLGMGTLAPSSANWTNLGNWANSIGSPTVLSSGTSSGGGNSKGKSMSGGIGH
jgi:hypothetical protein